MTTLAQQMPPMMEAPPIIGFIPSPNDSRAPGVMSVPPVISEVFGPSAAGRRVRCNGTVLSQEQLAVFDCALGCPMGDGAYWYDARWGACGRDAEGRMATFLPPGLDLGGPMRTDASKGATGVFINGR